MSEVGEGQHRRWRGSIEANINSAGEAAGEDPKLMVEVYNSANIAGSNMMIAERIGEVARALNDRDALVTSLHEDNVEGKRIAGRLQRANLTGSADEIEKALNQLSDWAADSAEVDHQHGAIEADLDNPFFKAAELEGEAPEEALRIEDDMPPAATPVEALSSEPRRSRA